MTSEMPEIENCWHIARNSIFPQQYLQDCQEADKGDLRGRTLKYAGQDEHLGSLSNILLKHIFGLEEKQQLEQEVLAAKDQLPLFYMVAKGDRFSGVKWMKTSEEVEKLASKVEARATRIEKLKEFNAIFGTICEKALAVNADLMKLNEEASNEDVSAFKNGTLTEFLACKADLTERIDLFGNNVIENIIGKNASIEDLFKVLALDPQGTTGNRSLLKAVTTTEEALKKFSKYEEIFESCLKGIEAKVANVSVASQSDSDQSDID